MSTLTPKVKKSDAVLRGLYKVKLSWTRGRGAVVYFKEESEICSKCGINPMGRLEFCHVVCSVAVVCQS